VTFEHFTIRALANLVTLKLFEKKFNQKPFLTQLHLVYRGAVLLSVMDKADILEGQMDTWETLFLIDMNACENVLQSTMDEESIDDTTILAFSANADQVWSSIDCSNEWKVRGKIQILQADQELSPVLIIFWSGKLLARYSPEVTKITLACAETDQSWHLLRCLEKEGFTVDMISWRI